MPMPPYQSAYEYQAGGTLPVGSPTYVYRDSDDILFNELKGGRYSYVLNSRQMGKSSLRVNTMKRLREAGMSCGSLDLSRIGTQSITPQQWYAGLIRILISSLDLSRHISLNEWWGKHGLLSAVQRFTEFLEHIMLAHITSQVVIFVDEIDSLLSRGRLADDFFAVIRACYNARADNPVYNRLTFALFGVADPTELINDKNRTPFNIGRSVQLTGFTLPGAEPLAKGLVDVAEDPTCALREVLAWTGGQPFLTQKVCKLLTEAGISIRAGAEPEVVTSVVTERIITDWETKDEPEHLKTIRNRIVLSPAARTARLLSIYGDILRLGSIEGDDSAEQMELQLSGLVVEHEGRLSVYNRVYGRVFNEEWVEKLLAELRPYAQALDAWFASGKSDESRLLRGKTLQDAQVWSAGKGLGQQDYEFLAASQDLGNREVQKALEAEQEANRMLTAARQKAEKRIRYGTITLVTTILLAGAFAFLLLSRAEIARAELEKAKSQTNLVEQSVSHAKALSAQLDAMTEVTREKLAVYNKKLAFAQVEMRNARNETAALRRQAEYERETALQEQKVAEASLLEVERQRAIAEARLREIEQRRKAMGDKDK